jgi:hypothetical protein
MVFFKDSLCTVILSSNASYLRRFYRIPSWTDRLTRRSWIFPVNWKDKACTRRELQLLPSMSSYLVILFPTRPMLRSLKQRHFVSDITPPDLEPITFSLSEKIRWHNRTYKSWRLCQYRRIPKVHATWSSLSSWCRIDTKKALLRSILGYLLAQRVRKEGLTVRYNRNLKNHMGRPEW